jgi:uncharacterized protein YbbK (DUF523 family)
VALAKEHGITIALLKDGSPSCGSKEIYDGRFAGSRIAGAGVTAAALRAAGGRVYNEHQIAEADAALRLT